MKVYATRSSITSPIPDSYNPIAQSATTIKNWHKNYPGRSYVISLNFVIFPIITIILIVFTTIYYNDLSIGNRMENIEWILKQKDQKMEYKKWDLQNELSMSVIFVYYVLALSFSAVQFFSETEKHLDDEIKKIISIIPDEQKVVQLGMISALPLITLTIDLVIVNAMAVFGLYAGLQCLKAMYLHERKEKRCIFCFFIIYTVVLISMCITGLGLIVAGISTKKTPLTVAGLVLLALSVFGHLCGALSYGISIACGKTLYDKMGDNPLPCH